jgi:hypothetical protein
MLFKENRVDGIKQKLKNDRDRKISDLVFFMIDRAYYEVAIAMMIE